MNWSKEDLLTANGAVCLGFGERKEKEGMGGMGWAHRKGGESGRGRGTQQALHSALGQEKNPSSVWLLEWPHAAQTHLCGCDRTYCVELQTWTHLTQSWSQRSR